MKKVMIGMLAVGFVIGLAFTAFSAEVTEKSEVKTKGDTTIEKTEVKSGGVKAKETTKTSPTKTETKAEVKGKGVKMEKERTDTAEGSKGKAKVKIKDGALKKLSITWAYWKVPTPTGWEYKLVYNVKDKADPDLKTKLNLSDEQYKMLKPGKHEWTSTRDIGDEVKWNFEDIIAKDLISSVK